MIVYEIHLAFLLLNHCKLKIAKCKLQIGGGIGHGKMFAMKYRRLGKTI
jgi:hypothetical protein